MPISTCRNDCFPELYQFRNVPKYKINNTYLHLLYPRLKREGGI